QPIGPVDPIGQQHPGALEAPEIGDSDTPATKLVLVGRTDTPPGCAELLTLLARGIQQLVIRKHQMGAIGDEETAASVNAPLGELIQLCEQVLGLEHYPVADNAGDPGVQNARGNLAENE